MNILVRIRHILIVIIMPIVTGCSLLATKNEPITQYYINKTPKVSPKGRVHQKVLLVLTPEADSIYDTKKMAYSTQPYRIDYFAKNQWAEKPADMLRPLMVQTLQDSHYFHAVVVPPFNGHYDYLLSTQLIELKQDLTKPSPTLQLRFNATLISNTTNKTIATKQFHISQPMMRINPYDGVYAANCATAHMLEQLTTFIEKSI